LELPAKIDLKLGKTIELKAGQGAERYQWSPAEGLSCVDCPNPVFKAQQGGQYCVEAFLNGCQKDTCTTITVGGDCPVYLPNAFSPNADGQNDTFCAYSPCLAQAELSIFDRWGNLLYKGDCWDGRSRGQELVIGTYFYQLSGVDILGARVVRSGEFWLGR
jgi:gliding motility-associated-like protein